MADLIFYEKPKLNQPYLVLGFAGWPNAGEVATGTIEYLVERLGATRFAEIPSEEFYDFTSLRPIVVAEDGLVRGLKFATNDLYYWKHPEGDHDLILFSGIEPHLRWRRFAENLLKLAEEFGVVRLFTLGGLFDWVPHTREPRVSAVVNNPRLKLELQPYGLSWTEYQGPSSFHSALHIACLEKSLEAVSLWGHAPIYIQTVRNPKVCHALLRRLAGMLGISLDLEDMRHAGEHLDEALNRLVAQNPELQQYMARFEAREEGERPPLPPAGEPLKDADKIVREVEEFFRREQGKKDGEPS